MTLKLGEQNLNENPLNTWQARQYIRNSSNALCLHHLQVTDKTREFNKLGLNSREFPPTKYQQITTANTSL